MSDSAQHDAVNLQKQFDLSNQVYGDLQRLQLVIDRAEAAQAKLKAMRETATGPEAVKLDTVLKQVEALQGGESSRRRGQQAQNLNGVRSSLVQLLTMLQEVDRAPTSQTAAQVPVLHHQATDVIQLWSRFEAAQLAPMKLQ